ncbi:hypothetical protein RKD26_003375 [Streptomyces calvus]
MPNAPSQDTFTTSPAPTALTGVPIGTAKSCPVCRFAHRAPPLPYEADSTYVSTGATQSTLYRVRGWSSRTAPRQAPDATEASAWPWSFHRAVSSLRSMPCFRAASSTFRRSSRFQAAAALASSRASRASARSLRPMAWSSATSACHTAR